MLLSQQVLIFTLTNTHTHTHTHMCAFTFKQSKTSRDQFIKPCIMALGPQFPSAITSYTVARNPPRLIDSVWALSMCVGLKVTRSLHKQALALIFNFCPANKQGKIVLKIKHNSIIFKSFFKFKFLLFRKQKAIIYITSLCINGCVIHYKPVCPFVGLSQFPKRARSYTHNPIGALVIYMSLW